MAHLPQEFLSRAKIFVATTIPVAHPMNAAHSCPDTLVGRMTLLSRRILNLPLWGILKAQNRKLNPENPQPTIRRI